MLNQTTSNNFFTQPGLGTLVADFLFVMGLLIVVFAIVRVVKDVAAGQIGKAFKTVIGALVLASFMLFPGSLIYPAISAFKGVVSSVINTVSSFGGNSTGTTIPGAPSNTTPTVAVPTTAAPLG
jgi:hypothetical protein